MRLGKLSHQILVVFVAVVVLSLGASGWAVTTLAQRIVADNVARGHQELARRIAEEIDLEMGDIRPILQLLAESKSLREMEPVTTAAELTRYQAAFPTITRLYVAGVSGQQIARSDDQPLEDVSTNFGFQLAREGHELVSDVYLPRGREGPALTFYLPVVEEGELAGLLVADVNFARIQAILDGLALTRDETAVVFAQNGRAVAHSRLGELGQPPALDDTAVIETLVSGSPGVLEGYTDELGREVVGVHAPVSELGWGLVIQTPVGELAAEVARLRRAMWAGLSGGVFLAVVAGWLMAGRLAEPIGRLARATERVAAGDLTVAVETSASNEVGLLAKGFNRMVAALRASRDEAERLYEEVQQLNVGLEQRINLATREVRQRADGLAALYGVGRDLAATLDLEALLPAIAQRVTDTLEADRCAVFLFDERAKVLRARAAHGYMAERLADFSYRSGEEIVGQVYATGEPQYAPDLDLAPALPQRDAIRAVLAAPLTSPTAGPLGVLSVASLRAEAFTPDQQQLLETMAGQIARAIESARLYEAAQEADRLKSAFLASMSHELRTPLNSIIGFTGIVLQELAGPLSGEQTKQLGMVQDSARHLLNLINDVLDISKIEAGQLEIACEPFDVRETIEKAVQTVTPLAEKRGLALVAEIAPEVGEIISDRRRVEQILINLANNAIKFTDKGQVTVTADRQSKIGNRKSVIRIQVVDTGVGIKPEDMDKLFEPFRQVETGLTRQYEGTGLGLSICKRLVEMLGGEIWAESEWGVGSTFTFTLPAGQSLRGA